MSTSLRYNSFHVFCVIYSWGVGVIDMKWSKTRSCLSGRGQVVDKRSLLITNIIKLKKYFMDKPKKIIIFAQTQLIEMWLLHTEAVKNYEKKYLTLMLAAFSGKYSYNISCS